MPRRPNPDHEIASEDSHSFQQDALARLPLMTNIALEALKALMLINGGAIAGLLTFVGNAPSERFDLGSLKIAFAFFIGGLFLTTAANIAGYIAQSMYFQASMSQSWNAQARKHDLPEKWKDDVNRSYGRGSVAEIAAIIAVVLGLSCFGLGSYKALDGILPSDRMSAHPRQAHKILKAPLAKDLPKDRADQAAGANSTNR